MFKILIVDDERFIRKGIRVILERNLSEPVECIEARNGIDALEKAEEETPDLIITDINMPGCDGLEFVRELKQKQVNSTVIILSGYENFEYAKQAIKLGIKEYVMKPIKKAEFIELINRYIKDIQQQHLKSQEEIERRIENNRIMEGVKKDFLIGLLKCSSNKEAHQYLQQLKELQVVFEPQLYTCIVFQYEVNQDNREYMDFVAKNILDEYLSLESEDFLINVTYDVGKNVSIFKTNSASSRSEERKKIIRQAARLVREYGQARVFAGIGDVAPDFEHLNQVLRHALQAADYKIFDRGDIVCVFDEIESGQPVSLKDLSSEPDVLEIWNDLNQIYSLGQTQVVMDALKCRYEETAASIRSKLAKRAVSWGSEDDFCKEFSLCWSLDELKQEIKKGLDELDQIKDERNNVNVQMIEQIIQFVDENITKEISLNLVADKFQRSPGYISTMFKRYSEDGFNSYVTEKRMEIARKLLKDSRTPIQEVAEACGFYNAKYFSVVFKKHLGLSPREYRENL